MIWAAELGEDISHDTKLFSWRAQSFLQVFHKKCVAFSYLNQLTRENHTVEGKQMNVSLFYAS